MSFNVYLHSVGHKVSILGSALLQLTIFRRYAQFAWGPMAYPPTFLHWDNVLCKIREKKTQTVIKYVQFKCVFNLCSTLVYNSDFRYSWGTVSRGLAFSDCPPVTIRVAWRNTEMASRYGWPSVGLNSGLLRGRPERIACISSKSLWSHKGSGHSHLNQKQYLVVRTVHHLLGGEPKIVMVTNLLIHLRINGV